MILAGVLVILVMRQVKSGGLSVVGGTVWTVVIMAVIFLILLVAVKALFDKIQKIIGNLGRS